MLAANAQAMQHCGYPTFSTELYLPALEFSWPDWRLIACLARTSISARLAFHCSRQLKVEGTLSACVVLEISNGHLYGVKRS